PLPLAQQRGQAVAWARRPGDRNRSSTRKDRRSDVPLLFAAPRWWSGRTGVAPEPREPRGEPFLLPLLELELMHILQVLPEFRHPVVDRVGRPRLLADDRREPLGTRQRLLGELAAHRGQ